MAEISIPLTRDEYQVLEARAAELGISVPDLAAQMLLEGLACATADSERLVDPG